MSLKLTYKFLIWHNIMTHQNVEIIPQLYAFIPCSKLTATKPPRHQKTEEEEEEKGLTLSLRVRLVTKFGK